MRTHGIRRIAALIAAVLTIGTAAPLIAPAFAQAPPPIPALPDSERRTRYTLTAQTGPLDVGFSVYGDGTDYGAWLEVWLNGTKLVPITDWTLSLASGTLATSARPLTNARITLTTARTGTLDIVGARRPRRTTQLQEGAGVTARALNQVFSDLTAQERESWDRFNRTLRAPAGETLPPLPPASERMGVANSGTVLGFDGVAGVPIATLLSDLPTMVVGSPGPAGYVLTSVGASATPLFRGYTATGAGAVQRTWPAKLGDFASVSDWGTITDGVLASGRLYFPIGPTTLAAPLTVDYATCFIGSGTSAVPAEGNTVARASTIRKTGALNGFNVTGLNDDSEGLGTCFRDLAIMQLNGAGGAASGIAINAVATASARPNWIKVQNVNIEAVSGKNDWQYCGVLDGSLHANLIRDSLVENSRCVTGAFSTGGWLFRGTANMTVNNVRVDATSGNNSKIEFASGTTSSFGNNTTASSLIFSNDAFNAVFTGGAFSAVAYGAATSLIAVTGCRATIEPTVAGTNNWFNCLGPNGWLVASAGDVPYQFKIGSMRAQFDSAGFDIGSAGGLSAVLKLRGTTSGVITDQVQAAAGTYNWNRPTSAGSSGQPLLSGGGGASPMTFGTLGIGGGGTGQTTATAAFNALSPLTTLGDVVYHDGSNGVRLGGNITATRKFLRQTGNGSISAAPTWDTILASDITGAALTKSDDTNITLTLGGSPTNALLNAASLTLGWSGQLGVTRGGTGLSGVSQGDLPYASASNTFAALAKDTNATRYLSNTGASNNPAWAQIALATGVSGQLPLANGGCNASLTASLGGVLYSTATACAVLAGTPTANQPLLSGASGAPSWAGIAYPAAATSGGVPFFSSTSAMASSSLLAQNQIVLGGGAGNPPATLGSLGTTTNVLHGNAAGAPSFAAVVSADLNITTTSCTNQFVTAISVGAVGTCTTDTLAGAQHANQGTTTTLLHGNAAGNPSWSAVSLTADVTGTLPEANGGTGNTGGAGTTFTPTVSCDTPGAFAVTSNTGAYQQIGKYLHFSAAWTVSNIGSCASFMTMVIPNSKTATRKTAYSANKENGSAFENMYARSAAAATSIVMFGYSGANPVALNYNYTVSGVVEVQ